MPLDHCLSGLKSMREQRKITAPELADRIGVSINSYYRYERGDARIQFDRVCTLADMLGCSTDDLRRHPDTAARQEATGTVDVVGWEIIE